jgi:hypothetical protein
MSDLAVHQADLREKRREQLVRRQQLYDAQQALQLVSEEIAAKALNQGTGDLPPMDPLKVKQSTLTASLPGLQDAVKNADQAVAASFDQLYTDLDFQQRLTELPGDTPFLLFPVRLETRFCRTRHFVRPAAKEWLIDYSALNVPAQMAAWGVQRSDEGVALQVRGPFPHGVNEAQFNTLILNGLESGVLKPANGQWLQRKRDALELRVRILPDDINIDSFEASLTPAELGRGQQFWQRVWKGDKPEDAWSELRSFFSTPRSAWIVRQSRPTNFVDDAPLPAQPQFPELPLRANSYTQQPFAAALPDFFVAILYKTGQPERLVQGNFITTAVATGFDPNEPDSSAFQPNAEGDLRFPAALRWIFDFDEAEKRGMAIRVPLAEPDFAAGFDKLVVLGVRLSTGKDEGKEVLERLFRSQLYSEKGMYVLPQATPTNNFEGAKSGYNRTDQEAAHYFKATWKGGHAWTAVQRSDAFAQPDGLRLTEALGMVEEISQKLPGADTEDGRNSLAMNRLLYPGTLGYWVRQFFSPPLREPELDALQSFFERFVSGGGLLPAVRIGQQPYGIVPATAFRLWKSTDSLDFSQRLLDGVLKKVDGFWEALKHQVLFAGDGRVTADQLSEDLLRLAGSDAASSRYMQQAMFGENYLNLMLRLNLFQYLGLPGNSALKDPPAVNQYQSQVEPQLRAKLLDLTPFAPFRFMHLHGKKRMLDGPLVEELPASEQRGLQKLAGSTWSYFDWLLQSSIEDLWKESFKNIPLVPAALPPPPPRALLYHLARFALRRSALESALRLLEPDAAVRLLKTKDLELLSLLSDTGSEFAPSTLNDQNLIQRSLKPLVQSLGIQSKFTLIPDRFTYFGQTTGSPAQAVKDIVQQGQAPAAAAFARQRQTIAALKDLPTARLQRLLCEHLDLCGYRIDAWFNGIVLDRLSRQRSSAAQGIYLGAFGLLENVMPGTPANFVKEIPAVFSSQLNFKTVCLPLINTKLLEAAHFSVATLLANSFVYLGDSPSTSCRLDFAKRKVVIQISDAPGNQGFIHAPSPDHASTAAILRAAWQSRQSEGGNSPGTLAVRLDSARVRNALALVEGLGQGDSLAALLGYQLERRLHDSNMDSLIFKVRRAFPLKTDEAANAFAATTDGLAVVLAWRLSHVDWGIPQGLSDDDRHKINPLVEGLDAQFDALSDLMLTESVFQTVKGSIARSAAALRTLDASGQVHQPEVIHTPQRGSLVIFRTGMVFPGNNFLARWGKTITPRAAISAKLNNWLGGQLPDPTKVIITAIPAGGTAQKLTLAELDVQPLDLLATFPPANAEFGENNDLAWKAQSVLRRKLALPSGTAVKIDFTGRAVLAANELTITEISSLVYQLRDLVAAARPLTAADFLREGGLGAAPLFNASTIQQPLVKIVKTERQPAQLAGRLQAARNNLAAALGAGAKADVLQPPWTALLQVLAECALWQMGNLALETSNAFEAAQADLLLQRAERAAADLQRMQADAEALIAQILSTPVANRFEPCERAAERLFGKGFRVCPAIQLTNVPVVAQARTADLSRNFDVLALENWQCHSALVHPVFRIYRQCALLREALAAPQAEQTLTVIQFNSPSATPGFWIGAEMRGMPPGTDVSQTFGGTLSLNLELPLNWNPASALAGLIFDEWTEMLTARETTTGVTFHFNQPDTEPPQVMLLAVCPAEGENWKWEYLSETILDTFERAKKRLIQFDHLRTNPALAHLLPAVLAPLERDNLAPNLDLGRNKTDVLPDARGAAPLVSL